MVTASHLLFERRFNNASLFKNQQDLVNHLINDQDSAYFVDKNDFEDFTKAQSRLKAYVSQLLSPSVTRNITEDFKNGLISIIDKKINNQVETINLVNFIIEDLKEKNSLLLKQEPQKSIADQFNSDFSSGTYIAIITSKPLEIESEISTDKFSLRQVVFNNILDCLVSSQKDFKNYRFNFALQSSGTLFWKGLRKMLTRHLKQNIKDKELFNTLYGKFTIKTKTHNQLIERNDHSEDYLKEVIDEILLSLNRNRYIMVFIGETPIFTMPVVAINPADFRNMKLYALLDDNNQNVKLHKYSNEDIVLWRLFVWDKLKSKKFAGINFEYTKDI